MTGRMERTKTLLRTHPELCALDDLYAEALSNARNDISTLCLKRGWVIKSWWTKGHRPGESSHCHYSLVSEPDPGSLVDRFMKKVVAHSDGCWIWTGATVRDKYGEFKTPDKKAPVYAHRWSYEQFIGPIPEGLTIDHLCRNTRCVNPKHLEPVTLAENLSRGNGVGARHARQTQCVHGHPFDEENTRIKIDSRGRRHRQCRSCDQLIKEGEVKAKQRTLWFA